MKGIVFFDRDGTLIEEVGYLNDPSGVRLLSGAADGLRRLSGAGYLVAVVSNQAGVARGKITAAQMARVHRAFLDAFEKEGVRFDAVEYCPHHPEGVVAEYRASCSCRKPAPGMAEAVLRRFRVPEACPRWVVGDKMTDILLGVRLRAKSVLVATGYGEEERRKGAAEGIFPDAFLPGAREAAMWILSGGSG